MFFDLIFGLIFDLIFDLNLILLMIYKPQKNLNVF